jgi:hypothetical protein
MTKAEVFAAIKNLVSPTVEQKFERVALEGGEVFITNQTEDAIALGDTIYVETESGFEVAPVGLHRLEDGREIVLDDNSVVVEIREEVEEEVVEEEVVVDETEEVVEASVESAKISELKTAIHDLLLAFESHANEMDERFKSLEADYNAFKKEAEYSPIKKDNSFKTSFSKFDARLEALKSLKK